MMVTKGELFAKLGELFDDADVRFNFSGEELEIEMPISIEPGMNEAWINLYPKAEDPQAEYYIGRHRKQD